MVSKVLKVFYGADYLPYKDSERTIHFPVGGNTFAGTQNTFRICFYPRDLVGSNDLVEQTSWVLVSKLANGKLGYQLLNAINTDSDLGEKYLVFDLSSYYSQYKGVVKLAIRGYQGEISFVEDEDTGTYSVQGTPIIGVTGTIDIAINYSPMVHGEELLPSELDQLVAMFSEYATTNYVDETFVKNIGWLEGTTTLQDIYDQIKDQPRYKYFVCSTWNGNLHFMGVMGSANELFLWNTSSIYSLSNVAPSTTLTQFFANATVQHFAKEEKTIAKLTITSTSTLQSLYNQIGNDPAFVWLTPTYQYYLVRLNAIGGSTLYYFEFECVGGTTPSFRYVGTIDRTAQINSVLTSTYAKPYATQDYVDTAIQDFLQNEYTKVDITTYPTLDDFLASEGEQGFIYLYPINTSDPTQGYYQYIWEDDEWVSLGSTNIDLTGYVEKTSSANKVYGTNELGAQATYTVDDFYEGNIARRDTDGSITVPLTPTQNGHASSKKYVDDLTTLKTLNGVDLHGTGNIDYDTSLNESSTNAVQNKVITQNVNSINYRLSIINDNLFETVLTELPYKVDYATEYLIPSTLSDTDGTHGVVFSETQLDYFEGNGIIMNNQVAGGNFEVVGAWQTYLGSLSVADNIGTFTATGQYGCFYRSSNILYQHKYLVSVDIKLTTGTTDVKIGFNRGNTITTITSTTSTTDWQYIRNITTSSNSSNDGVRISDFRSSGWDAIQVKNFMLIDLTQMFGAGNEPTTTSDVRIQWLLSLGYIPYNTGEIKNTTVSGMYSTNNTRIKQLPVGYQQVNYIQSSGTQYINIGYNLKSNSIIKLKTDFQLGCIIGCQNSSNFGLAVVADGTTENFKVWSNSANAYAYNNQMGDIEEIEIYSNKIVFNSNNIYYAISPAFSQISQSLYVFARNNNGTVGNYRSGKLEYLEIYEETTLVRDFVPCYRKVDNVIGLYDLVNDVFYTNAGTGTFLKGNDAYYTDVSFTSTELLGALSVHDTLSIVEGNVIEGEQRYDLVKISNVRSVDLGLCNWTAGNVTSGGNYRMVSNDYLNQIVGGATGSDTAIAICSKYEIKTPNNTYYEIVGLTIGNDGSIIVYDTNYNQSTSAPAFKTDMSGVMLNCVLATPTTTTIATDLTFEQVTLLIQEGGTIGVNFTNEPPNVQTKFVVKKAVGE